MNGRITGQRLAVYECWVDQGFWREVGFRCDQIRNLEWALNSKYWSVVKYSLAKIQGTSWRLKGIYVQVFSTK